MKYVAIDCETTGLHRQLLEFAAVFAELGNPRPVAELPIFHTYVIYPKIQGSAYALAIERIAKRECGWNYTDIEDLAFEFSQFIANNDCADLKDGLVIAGKTHFVERIPDWSTYFKVHHRFIDPMPLFMRPGDTVPPDLSECLKRAGLPSAAADAFDVISLLDSLFVDTNSRVGRYPIIPEYTQISYD